MPAYAGIQSPGAPLLDSRLHGNDAMPQALVVYICNGHLIPTRVRQGRDCWPEMRVWKSLLSESIFEPTEVAHTAQR